MKNKLIENPQANGLHPLGEIETEVKITLTEQDKLELGQAQSTAMIKAAELEADKKRIADDYKGQVEKQELVAWNAARTIRDGFRMERRVLDCFIDFVREKRVYVDKKTGEVLKEEPMRQEDRQLRMVS